MSVEEEDGKVVWVSSVTAQTFSGRDARVTRRLTPETLPLLFIKVSALWTLSEASQSGRVCVRLGKGGAAQGAGLPVILALQAWVLAVLALVATALELARWAVLDTLTAREVEADVLDWVVGACCAGAQGARTGGTVIGTGN